MKILLFWLLGVILVPSVESTTKDTTTPIGVNGTIRKIDYDTAYLYQGDIKIRYCISKKNNSIYIAAEPIDRDKVTGKGVSTNLVTVVFSGIIAVVLTASAISRKP